MDIGSTVNFKTLVQSGINKGESVIGYKIGCLFNNPKANYGVSLNPDKHNDLDFNIEDRAIVIATVEYQSILYLQIFI